VCITLSFYAKSSVKFPAIRNRKYGTNSPRDVSAAQVHIHNVQLPKEDDVKYLGLHLDRRLTCKNTFSQNRNN
jgi:hypothetical protein